MPKHDLDQELITLMSDGKPRTLDEIYLAIYGREQGNRATLKEHIRKLRKQGYAETKRISNCHLYGCSGADFYRIRGIDLTPDAIVGKKVDTTKRKDGIIMELLSDGKVRTTEQLATAYYTMFPNAYNNATERIAHMNAACLNLLKWKLVERVEIKDKLCGWRATP